MEILDIGCGNGKQIIQAIKILKKSGRIVGIDLSKKSIIINSVQVGLYPLSTIV